MAKENLFRAHSLSSQLPPTSNKYSDMSRKRGRKFKKKTEFQHCDIPIGNHGNKPFILEERFSFFLRQSIRNAEFSIL